MTIVIYIINVLRIDCGFSRNQLYIHGVYLITLIVLFSNFYFQSYINKRNNSNNNNGQKKSEWTICYILLVQVVFRREEKPS